MKNLIRLVLIGLLASTTGCFGWTEGTIARYCGCRETREAARSHLHEQQLRQIETLNGGQFDDVGNALREIDGIVGATSNPEVKPCSIHDPGHDLADTAMAALTVPVVAVTEGAVSVVAVSLFIVALPILIPLWPKC